MPATQIELTDKGWKEAKKVWEKLQENPEFNRIEMRLKFAAKPPLTFILAYVYGMYPDYTGKNKIKYKVDKWRRRFWEHYVCSSIKSFNSLYFSSR